MKIREVLELDKLNGTIYITSDLHIGHENVIKYDNRPFNSVEEMNTFIIQELKTKLKPEDILIDLGDMFWDMNWIDCKKILDEIPCEKVYKTPGNHDRDGLYFGEQAKLYDCFTQLSDIIDIRFKLNGKSYRASLCHYPLLEWNHKFRGAMMIHGHTHGSLDTYNDSVTDLRVDIGYNSNLAKKIGSFLIPLQEIITHFYEKTGGVEFYDWADQHKGGRNENKKES